ncbi:MAG: hypothetical protein NWE89_10760 [Candidatus Bathyarchaeota archaeon]|nr:hypothetical protein [Candidatus Bathyarchaeota archaeon]
MSVERKVTYFEKPGKEHTEETLKIALAAAKERGIDTILVSSTTGYTAEKAVEIFGKEVKMVVVTHATGYREKGVQMMPDETRAKLNKAGAKVVTCTDVLTGAVGAGVGRQRPTKSEPQEGRLPWIVPPPNIIVANTLRMFSQGVKVCPEIAMMAVDSNAIPSGKKVVAVAGSHAGADTAMVLDAAESSRIRDVKLHEILCKPL